MTKELTEIEIKTCDGCKWGQEITDIIYKLVDESMASYPTVFHVCINPQSSPESHLSALQGKECAFYRQLQGLGNEMAFPVKRGTIK